MRVEEGNTVISVAKAEKDDDVIATYKDMYLVRSKL